MLIASVLGRRSICASATRVHGLKTVIHRACTRARGGSSESKHAGTRGTPRRRQLGGQESFYNEEAGWKRAGVQASRPEKSGGRANNGDTDIKAPSLIEQLFPEESKRYQAERQPREIPRLPLHAEEPIAPEVAKVRTRQPEPTRSTSYHRARELAKFASSVLVLRNAGKHLSIEDFRRLIPQGKHIEGWTLEQGDIVKVIPGRDINTLEANGAYYLLFSSPLSAFAYQGHVTRIARLIAQETPTSLYSGIAPPPGYMLDGMDAHAAIEAYTLLPSSQTLALRQLKPPLTPFVESLVKHGGYPRLMNRPEKLPFELRLTLEGPQVDIRRIRYVIYESGRARALSWSGGDEMNVAISEWEPRASRQNRGEVGKKAPSEDSDTSLESGDDVKADADHGVKRRTLSPVYILGFHTEHAAQSFKCYWHRQPMDWKGSHRDEEGDLAPIANVDLLW